MKLHSSHEQALLSALLDKYERSNFYRRAQQPTRRILLKLYDNGQRDFQKYDIENIQEKLAFHNAVLSLHAAGLVFFEWMKGEENHILSKVWLNAGSIPEAYTAIDRIPKGDVVDNVRLELLELLDTVQSSWVRAFIKDTYEAISRTRSLGLRFPADSDERRDFLFALQKIDQIADMEILERIFSMQCFGDSKRFEKVVKPRLLNILVKYLDCEESSTEEELLRQIGIARYPEQFEFCGQIKIVFDSGIVDYSCLHSGGVLTLPDLLRGRLHISDETSRVLSIENRANYYDYICKSKDRTELVLYHGGQFSPSKHKFLLSIAEALPAKAQWYHWSDIDYGGFLILERLRKEVKPEVLPFRMSLQELIKYSSFTVPIKKDYIKKLQSLKQHETLADCFTCLDYMIEYHIKLEQEAMLTDLEDTPFT